MNDGAECRQELEEKERRELARYALKSAQRREQLGDRFREYREQTPLEYRTEYHRDRDRVIWSSAFRRLQHKTQIFPHYAEDHYRRRLTHSLEVAQIAGTLCRALKLNEVAAEAMGLGHDIGHAPFGHAGELSLNRKLQVWVGAADCAGEKGGTNADAQYSTKVLLYGFDHCVQGVEQVSRISVDYKPSYPGLNLTFDIRDGILKHICALDPVKAQEEDCPFSSLANIVKLENFAEFRNNCGTLEAQCVWFADKVGYLLGDMEDALRARIFEYAETKKSSLVKCLWQHYQDKRKHTESLKMNSQHEFLAFKRKALAVLILDCVDASTERIRDANLSSVDDVLEHRKRLVDVGDRLRTAWDEFYVTFQEGKLYKHEEVKRCEFKAVRIVNELFDAYSHDEYLIPEEFREGTEKTYYGILDPEQRKLMAARNYVAGMTDSFATEQHKRLYMSSERAGLL